MIKKLSEIAREQKIRYFLISFTDLFGVQRAKLVPATQIDTMAAGGAGFAGFAAWLDLAPSDPDMLAVADIVDTPAVDRLSGSTGDSCFTDCQLAQTKLIVQTPSHHLPKHFDSRYVLPLLVPAS